MLGQVGGLLRWNARNLVYLLVLHCDRVLFGSVLNLIKVEREIAYKLPINFSRPFSRKLRIRGSNLTTWK